MGLLEELYILPITDLILLANYHGCKSIDDLARILSQSFNMPSAEVLWEKYGEQLREKFARDHSAPKNADALPQEFFINDPTPNKKAVEWLIRNYLNDSIRLFEDLSRARVALDDYYYLLGKRAISNKYMLRLEVFCGLSGCVIKGKETPGLEQFLQDPVYTPFLQARDEKRGLAKKYHVNSKDYEEIYEDEIIRVIRPLTTAAACTFGAGTQWCTAATKGENLFEEYAKDGPMYVIQPKVQGTGDHKEKYQFHPNSGQFMDSRDEPITQEFDEKYGESMMKIPTLKDEYVKYILQNRFVPSERIPEYIKLISDKKVLDSVLLSNVEYDEDILDDNIEYDIALVDALLDAGADPNVTDSDGLTPLMVHSTNGIIIQLLLDAGADPLILDLNGHNALFGAAPDVMRILLDAGADPKVVTKDGYTPLNANSLDDETLQMLIHAGADPRITTKMGRNPFSYVNSLNMTTLLLNAGVNPDVVDYNSRTPLYRAIKYWNPEVVLLLLKNGANPNFKQEKLLELVEKNKDKGLRRFNEVKAALIATGAK